MDRQISPERISSVRREKIPGARISWLYNSTAEPDTNYLEINKNFIKLANIVRASDLPDQVWLLVKKARKQWMVETGITVGGSL